MSARGRRSLAPDAGYPLLGVALLLFWFRALFRGHTLVGADLGLFNLPHFQVMAGWWRAGRMAGWNPYMGLGQPNIADVSMAVFYPGNALLLVFQPLTALNLSIALHLALWFVGTYFLARALRLSPAGAFLSALTFSLAGPAVSHVHVSLLLAGIAWLPWGILAFLKALEAGGLARYLLASVPFALAFLASSLEFCLMGGVLALACAFMRDVPLRRALPALLGVGLFAMALAGISLVPFLHAFPDLNRGAGFSLERAGRWSFHPLQGIGLLVPGAMQEGGLREAAGQANRAWYTNVYLGFLPAAFVLVAFVRLRHDRRVRCLALVGLVFLGYACGRYSPVYRLLFEAFPPVRALRYPAKFFLPVVFCLAVLAGAGFDHVRRESDGRASLLRWLGATLAVLIALAAVGALAGRAADMARLSAQPLIVALLGLLAVATCPGRLRWRALLLLALLDVAVGGERSLGFVPRELYGKTPPLVPHIKAEERVQRMPVRVQPVESAWMWRPAFVPEAARSQYAWRSALVPNTGMPQQVRTFNGFSSFKPARVREFRAAAASVPLPRRLQRMGVNLVVFTAADPELARATEPLASDGPWRLGRLKDAASWCAFYPEPVPAASPAAALEQVLRPDHDPRSECVVEGLPPAGSRRAGGRGRVLPVRVEHDRIVLEVEADSAGVVVIREGWGSGWSAAVDGEQAPLLHADYLFRAVPVPAGRHRVELRYETRGWRLGLALTLLACGVLAGSFLLRRRDASASPPSSSPSPGAPPPSSSP